MEIESVKSRIKEIIQESTQLDPADLDEKAHLHKDLKIDSLTLLEIALSVDQKFETDFSEEELLKMESVQVAADMVMARLEGGSTAAA